MFRDMNSNTIGDELFMPSLWLKVLDFSTETRVRCPHPAIARLYTVS